VSSRERRAWVRGLGGKGRRGGVETEGKKGAGGKERLEEKKQRGLEKRKKKEVGHRNGWKEGEVVERNEDDWRNIGTETGWWAMRKVHGYGEGKMRIDRGEGKGGNGCGEC
jgi:hypothetical protein